LLSRSLEQGEIETTFGKKNFSIRKAGWESGGGGNYVEALGYNLFLSKISSSLNLHSRQSGSIEEALIQYLKEHQILIVLDNFEDVDSANKKMYTRFFERINSKQTESRVIITSRATGNFLNEARQIELDHLDGVQATELMLRRYIFLTTRRSAEGYLYSEPVLNFIQNYVRNKESLLDDIIGYLKPKLEHDEIQQIESNLKHPIMILRLTSILNSELVKTSNSVQYKEAQGLSPSRIMSIIIGIITDQQNEFLKWFEEVIGWIVKKAYVSLQETPAAIKILELLYQENSKMLSRKQIHSKLFNLDEFGEKISIATIERSIDAIERHVVFIEEITSDDYESKLKLSDRIVPLLPTIFVNLEADGEQSRSSPHTEYIETLNSAGRGSVRWDDFGQVTKDFLFARTNTGAEKQLIEENTLDSVEKALLERVLNGQLKHITTNFTHIARFLSHTGGSRGAIDFANKHFHLFIQNFDSLADEEVAGLCAAWFDENNPYPHFADQSNESLARLCSKILARGVQQNAENIREAYGKALAECQPERLKKELNDRAEHIGFMAMMKRFSTSLPWSHELQKLYIEMDVELADYDRFKTNVTDVYQNAIVVFHPDSVIKELEPHHPCYVVYGDLENEYVQLYIMEEPNQVHVENHPMAEDLFFQWLEHHGQGHPGLSADTKILGADMLAVKEFHNEHFLAEETNKKSDRFNRAQLMKKLFSRYYSHQLTATSMAFIIGYRSPLGELTLEQIQKYLTEEVVRRLDLFEQPNRYFGEEQIPDLIALFERHCGAAIQLIKSDTEGINSLLYSRRIKTLELEERLTSSEQNQIITQTSSFPNKFLSALRDLASTPMISRHQFTVDLIKKTGGMEKYDSQIKAYEHSTWTERKHLDISWIEIIAKAVFNRPTGSKYIRYEEKDLDELIEEILTLHGAISD
jgi:hypothetical protein